MAALGGGGGLISEVPLCTVGWRLARLFNPDPSILKPEGTRHVTLNPPHSMQPSPRGLLSTMRASRNTGVLTDLGRERERESAEPCSAQHTMVWCATLQKTATRQNSYSKTTLQDSYSTPTLQHFTAQVRVEHERSEKQGRPHRDVH